MKCATEDSQFEMFSVKSLGQTGFALPIFRSSNFNSNALYLAISEVPADLGSIVVYFDFTTLEPDRYLQKTDNVTTGDVWKSVFLHEDNVFSGASGEIFEDSKPFHREIRERSPLSFLDLSIGANSNDCASDFRFARKYLTHKFNADEANRIIAECTLRKLVNISLSRCFVGEGVEISLPIAIRNFSILSSFRDSFSVKLPAEASLILDSRQRERFESNLTEFFDLLDLKVYIDIERLFRKNIESPIDSNEVSGEFVKIRRTRRFGLAREIAIDLGTTNTRIFSGDSGLILSEPSTVSIEQMPGFRKIVAVGTDSVLMEGRTPERIEVIRPLRDGAISDEDIASEMIKHFIKISNYSPNILRPLDVVLCIPSGATALERRTFVKAAKNAGASRVRLIPQAIAAAMGAGLVGANITGSLILTIGGGTSEAAFIVMWNVSYSALSRVGGDKMTDAVIYYFKRSHNLNIGWSTAERIKREFGVASPAYADENVTLRVRGSDLVDRMPREVEVTQFEFSHAFEEIVREICELVKQVIENIDPEFSSEVVESGLIITGGGALLGSLDVHLESVIGLQVRLAEDPISSVARGISIAMNDSRLSGSTSEY